MRAATPIDGSGKGYVLLHRKLLDNHLFKHKPAAWLKIWIFILLRADWRESLFRPGQGKPIVVPAGSLITSLEKLGTHAALTKEHARRCLDYLERTQSVTLQRTHHWTMITVVNWASCQQREDEPQHALHHTEHHGDSENATHQTPHQTPHVATPSKEIKNLSKNYKSNSDELDSLPANLPRRTKQPTWRAEIDPALRQWFDAEFWPIYPRHEGKGKALEAAAAKAITPEKRSFYLERLKAQLPEYERRKQESSQRVIPMGSTWFNQDRAENDLPAPQAKACRPQSAAWASTDYAEYVPLSRAAG
jgi:hypothetical protein